MNNHIALLATGDELVHGDILNTTAPWIANQLIEQGFSINQHMTVTDEQSEIECALRHLLINNRIVITTGGLGPTSDDRTRYAIAETCKLPLIFDESSWDAICQRIRAFNFPITENNKQQALFPKNAKILPNHHGTANGCIVTNGHNTIIMLPGPPYECREMFTKYVMPALLDLHLHQPRYVKKWRVFNVSESIIAQSLEEVIQGTDAVLGYRVDYPYLEVKLFCNNAESLAQLTVKITSRLQPHFLNDSYLKATEKLSNYLIASPMTVFIEDNATKGYWQHLLLEYALISNLTFNQKDKAATDYQLQIDGLDAIWHATETTHTDTSIAITIMQENQILHFQNETLPFRGKRSLLYAAELISDALFKLLNKKSC